LGCAIVADTIHRSSFEFSFVITEQELSPSDNQKDQANPMSDYRLFPNLKVSDIFLPSDFSEASEIAFVHALKLAIAGKARLTMLHVDTGDSNNWEDFPGVRETLERWKLIPPNSPKDAVVKLDIDVRKIMLSDRDPVKACSGYLELHKADLIVLAIQQKDGIMGWFDRSIGEPIAKNSKQMTLFVPEGVQGFVSKVDGSVTLKNILLPVTKKPDPQPSIEAVIRLIEAFQLPPGNVTLLSVGNQADKPELNIPQGTSWTWNEIAIEGDPTLIILKAAEKLDADLIVMTTDGPDDFLSGLRGTTSERVLRAAKCPVATIPVESLLGL
jgi:nucleotide-binding universal stress UspA family protein